MSESTKTTTNNAVPRKKRIGPLWIVAIVIIVIMLSRHEPLDTIDCTPEIIATSPDVIMLGAWWCTYCYQAKKYFQKNDIHYCEYDMENTPTGRQLYEENGGGAVPILLIGDYKLQGFNKTQIEQALALLNSSTIEE